MDHKGALRRFLIVSFGFTWLCWVPVTLATYGLPSFTNPFPSGWFNDFLSGGPLSLSHWLILAGGVLGPLFGAIAGWQRLGGSEGVRALAHHLTSLRISDASGWLASLIPVAIFGIASLAVWVLSAVVIGVNVPISMFLFGILAGALLIAGEEMGWRGTQLPLLQEKRSAIVSSLIVAITWALWHIPLLLMGAAREGDDASYMAINLASALIPYLLLTIPLTIAHTFVFNSARGLIVVPIITHSLANAFNADMGPISGSEDQITAVAGIAGPILMASFWLVGLGLWALFKGQSLSWREKITVNLMLERARSS